MHNMLPARVKLNEPETASRRDFLFTFNRDRRRRADRLEMIPSIESLLSAYFRCVIFVATQAVKSPSP